MQKTYLNIANKCDFKLKDFVIIMWIYKARFSQLMTEVLLHYCSIMCFKLNDYMNSDTSAYNNNRQKISQNANSE